MEEAKRRHLVDVASFAYPSEQGALFAEIQRLKSLGKPAITVRKEMKDGTYFTLFTQPAGPKIVGKHGYKYLTVPNRKYVRVSKKTNR